MDKIRDTIFISHSTPEDNDFTIWLAARLQLLGYEVWIDKKQLLGGEKFWEDIDLTIRNKAMKFLLVYSKNICQNDSDNKLIPGKLKDGISKEYSLADSIVNMEKLKDFIILLNVDGSDYNLFIDAPRLNQIPFHNNWANGFNQLIKKLEKHKVPANKDFADNDFVNWFQSNYLSVNSIEPKPELYHSNWWEIKLPEFIYIYRFTNESQAKEIISQYQTYPLSRISNALTTFENYSQFEILYQGSNIIISPESIFKIKVSDILLGFDSDKYPTQKDCENSLKYLLNQIFHLIMKNRNMYWHRLANNRKAYFYTPSNLPSLSVKYPYPFRSESAKNKYKRKKLIGTYLSIGNWHYAVSSKIILYPFVAFSLKGHLVFTTDGHNLLKSSKNEVDKDRIHTLRRTKGKSMFNEAWRDLLLAFIFALKQNDKIEIELSSDFNLEMSQYPVNYWADFGYYDPNDKARQGLLSEEYSEVEEYKDSRDE